MALEKAVLVVNRPDEWPPLGAREAGRATGHARLKAEAAMAVALTTTRLSA